MDETRRLFEEEGEPLTESETRILYMELDSAEAQLNTLNRRVARLRKLMRETADNMEQVLKLTDCPGPLLDMPEWLRDARRLVRKASSELDMAARPEIDDYRELTH